MQPSGEPGLFDRRAPPRTFNLLLLGIALVSLIPRLLLGFSQYVEYDGYWHVWIAEQDRWANFIREYQANAHPPLYFLFLRMALLFGRTQLAYRSVSLIAGAASVYMVGRTALRAMQSPFWAALAALAYGLALPSILVSDEVRSYMLAAFLVQVSFFYFLDLTSGQPAPLRSRLIFAILATLACLTEYYALIYVGAALLISLVLLAVRREQPLARALLREAATFALILALPAWEYLSHFGAKSMTYDHLPDFYFQPGSAESAISFLLRNLRNELNCFSPWPVPEGPAFYAAMAAILAGAGTIVFLTRNRTRPKNLSALVTLVLPLIMMCAIMAGALLRAYPFGGFLRQQFILFPFFAVCPFLFFDCVLGGRPRPAIRIIAGLIAIGITLLNVRNYQAWPKVSRMLLTDQVSRYNRMFPAAQGIYIDQFNLITFFMHHDNWKWEFVAPMPGSADGEVYRLSRDNRSMLLFRDEDWILDLRKPELYSLMARGMKTWHVPSVTIFCLAQPGNRARTQAQVTAYRNRILDLAAANGLCEQTLQLENYDVYAEFRPAGSCPAQ